MPGAARARIAVINDDTTFLSLMSDLLESIEGYEVIVCKEGNNAYQFVKQHRLDLVILDIRMDHQETGWMILELLTLDPQTRPISMIVCSAAVTELHAHEPLLRKFGIDVLPKPFDLDVLLEKVKANLEKGSR